MKYLFTFFIALVLVRVIAFYAFPLAVKNGEVVHFQTMALDDSHLTNNKNTLTVRMGNFWQTVPVQLLLSPTQEIAYGDTLNVSGIISIQKGSVLNNEKTVLLIQNPKIKAKNDGFLSIFSFFRQQIISFCEKSFSHILASLMVGILLGVKSGFSNAITTSFRITGVMHVIAASGMNVTLVGGFLLVVLSHVFKRPYAVVGSMVGILVYAILSGLQPSIVRAALMGIAALSAQLLGRQYSGVYALVLVAELMLLWDPLLLVQVGFQLSVMATIGIMLLQSRLWKGLGDDFTTTLSAQIMTLPILLSAFGSYGVLSLLTNLLVLWTVPLIMIIGGVGVLVSFIFQPLGQFILFLATPLLWYFEEVVMYFGQFGWVVQVGSLPIALVVGYYLLLVTFLILPNRR